MTRRVIRNAVAGIAAFVAGAALPAGARAEPLPADAAGYERCVENSQCQNACFADTKCLERMSRWIDTELQRLRGELGPGRDASADSAKGGSVSVVR